MRIIFSTISFFFLLTSTFGQTCTHDDLSRAFRIIIPQIKFGDSIIKYQVPITVTLIDKTNKNNIQSISFTAISLYNESFTKCNRVRSYSTGKNRKVIIKDTDFGDVVIADFNFDSREDIAIKSDEELSCTTYQFYIQGEDKKFRLDPFLTDSMSVVPTYYNRAKKTLTTFQRAGVGDGEDVYQLDIRTNRWHRVKHIFLW